MNIKKIRLGFVCSVTLLLLSACTSIPINTSSNGAKRQDVAKQLEADGHYYDALTQWKILQLMLPESTQVNEHITRLESLISKEVKGLHARAKRDSSNTQLYLKILALNPHDKQAISRLRDIKRVATVSHKETKSTRKKSGRKQVAQTNRQSNESSSFDSEIRTLNKLGDYQGIIALSNQYLNKHPADKQALRHQFNALQSLANIQLKNNQKEQAVELLAQALTLDGIDNNTAKKQLSKLKNELSNDYTNRGIKLFKSDLEKAITMFKLGLKYNPENSRASQQLTLANKVKSNLEKIKSLSN
jgi:tetratricopeptide (TPR) repeat protein